ncbi:hypothetical protein AO501_07335 [Mycobacterium gordonae]|uniref:Uncharacterized protein n=1 Tax=Mycobacterium gordonae TaxID=1778 RepID=A0A0Q2LW37_MYCGO|nr:hypothetical protein [Mycobacterium gordonae]KQH79962.1 hypothetical protein AO501_07335 [Mycobacterium gordonae]
MSNHVEWGTAAGALYTLRTRDSGIEELRPDDEDDLTSPYILGLWNGNGDGLALQGTRREILHYLRLVIACVERETDPRPQLDQALTRLNTLRLRRADLDDANQNTDARRIARIDDEETLLLRDVAHAAERLAHEL